ncbi:MAG: glycosyltransferase family 39 protein [Clostridia bacterium]|nr:glycosyltransferase family 39 protein [Clostridia bacterium]
MEKTVEYCKKKFYIIYSLIGFFGVAVWVSLMWSKSIWFDEAYSFGMISRTYSDICKIAAADVHPPLYYLSLKLITSIFTNKLVAAKIYSIVPYIVILMFGGYQLRKLINEKTSIAFMIVFLTYPYMLSYAVEIRMYSVAAMFVFINAVYAYKCWFTSNKKDWCMLILSGVGAAYTHYFAFVTVIINYGFLFLSILITKKKIMWLWICSVIVSIIMFSPWIGTFISQLADKAENEYWIGPITVYSLKVYFTQLFGANGFPQWKYIIIVTYIGLFIGFIFNKKREHILLGLMSAMVPMLTIALGLIVSILIRPVFVMRYAIPAIPLLFVFVALALDKIDHVIMIIGFGLIVLSGFVPNYISQWNTEYNITHNEINEEFIDQMGDFDCVYTSMENNEQMFSCIMALYCPSKTVYRTERFDPVMLPFENLKMTDQFDESKNERILLIISAEKEVPSVFKNTYYADYKTTVNTQDTDGDVYILTHK